MKHVRSKVRFVLITCSLMVLSGLMAGTSGVTHDEDVIEGMNTTDRPIQIGEGYDNLIRFNELEFDPAEGILVPPNLRAITDYYIVQFDGPINSGWKDDLMELGVSFFWYLPNFGYIAKLPSGSIDEVKEHTHVRAVYPYHTAFKVPKDLWSTSFGPQVMEFRAVPLEEEAGIAAEIEARGGRVYGVSDHEVLFTLRGDMLLDIARLPQTGWVEIFREPTMVNDNYGRTIKVRQQSDGAFNTDGNSMWSYNAGNFPGLTAGEYIKVAVYDTGMDTTHPAYGDTPGDPPKLVWFKDYTDGSENDWHDGGSHGTHTSCTVLGNGKWRASDPGTDGRYAGMAPRARLIGQMGLSIAAGTVYTHLNEPLAHGANHTSNSWGDPGSYKKYTALSSNYDKYTRDANNTQAGNQEILSVFAAGNEGNTGPREPGVSKNVLTIGATGNDKGSSSNTVVGFSAKGPTDDGRMKPDIVTPGAGVSSCATGSNSYRSTSGTSMAAPGAAGGVAVVRSYYNATYGFTPSPALTKAIVVNGATPLPGYTYPGNTQGWGRMNLANSLLENNTKKLFYIEQDTNLALETGFSVSIPVTVKSGAPLRVSLVWTDVEGATNNPKPSLVNDLNLRGINPSDATYWGNKFSGGQSTTGGNADTINNVEGIYLPSPSSGDWSFRVEGFNIGDGPQDWGLAFSGDIDVGIPQLEAEDLIPTNLTVEPASEIMEGDEITLKADINNEGTRKTQLVKYQWWIDNQLEDILSFDGEVQAKGKVSIDYKWTAKRGTHELRLVLDPYNTHFEQNESNNWISTEVFVDNFGLELKSLNGTALKADPGGSATYFLELKNPGTVNDTFSLDYDEPPINWTVELDSDSIDVPPGETRTVHMTINAPQKALTSEYIRIQVRAESDGNITYKGFVNTVTSINQIAALRMETEGNTSSVVPSGKASYYLKLFNDGNGLDTVTLTVNGTPYGWFVGLSDYIAVLDPYSSMELSCIVTAPFNAEAGFEARVRVEGYSTSSISTFAEIVTTVDRTQGMNLSTEAEPAKVDPGGSADFSFMLKNQGNAKGTFALDVEVPEGWGSNITAEDVILLPFGQIDRVLTVTVPEDEIAGDYIILLSSVNDTEAVLTLEFQVTVLQIFELEAGMEPNYINVTKGDDAVFNLTVKNLGNGPDDFEFWLDSTTLLVYSTFSNMSLSLEPGEEGTVTLAINTSMIALGNHTIPIHVYSTRSQTSTKDMESIIEVVAPPPEKKDKPNKPNDPTGPIDLTPGDIRSGEGLMLIGLLILILLIVTAVTVVGYNKYRAMKEAKRAEEESDQLIDDGFDERPRIQEEDVKSYEDVVPAFDLEAHMASFSTSETVDTTAPIEGTASYEPIEEIEGEPHYEPLEAEHVEEDVEVIEEPELDDDEGLLPPQVVDDTVSTSMSDGHATEEVPEAESEPEAPSELDPEEKSEAEKDMEKMEKSLDDIMKELGD